MSGVPNAGTGTGIEPHVRLCAQSLEKQATNMSQANAFLTATKRDPEHAYLNEVSSVPLQQVLRTQQRAFANFYSKRARHQRRKARSHRQSAEYTRSGFRWRKGQLWLAKLDAPLLLAWSWNDLDPTTLDPSKVTVSRDPDGRWYAELFCDVPGPAPYPQTGSAVGLDMGLIDLAVCSDGVRYANPRLLSRKARNLARYQRRMARCQKGSANRAKARAKVARVIVIDRWHPTTKMCSACGILADHLKLSIREWTCPGCGTLHDRDLNAAKNILAAGLAVTACGDGVRHPGPSVMQPSAKQEPSPARVGVPHP